MKIKFKNITESVLVPSDGDQKQIEATVTNFLGHEANKSFFRKEYSKGTIWYVANNMLITDPKIIEKLNKAYTLFQKTKEKTDGFISSEKAL
jgi:hypothetical protein